MAVLWAYTDYVPSSVASCRGRRHITICVGRNMLLLSKPKLGCFNGFRLIYIGIVWSRIVISTLEISEDLNLHQHCCGNLKISCIFLLHRVCGRKIFPCSHIAVTGTFSATLTACFIETRYMRDRFCAHNFISCTLRETLHSVTSQRSSSVTVASRRNAWNQRGRAQMV
jgi:hypothetical protein